MSEYNWDDALVKQAMIRSAKQVILVADASKFNKVAFAHVAHLTAIHTLVTDVQPPPDVLQRLQEGYVQVLIAEPDEIDVEQSQS